VLKRQRTADAWVEGGAKVLHRLCFCQRTVVHVQLAIERAVGPLLAQEALYVACQACTRSVRSESLWRAW